jgi:hypothetical protein
VGKRQAPAAEIELMKNRGSRLLIAHMRSLDPDEPTARERLERALGEALVQELRAAGLKCAPEVCQSRLDDREERG